MKLISLSSPIIARWVRIYPYSRSPMYVCVKFGFYGCRFSGRPSSIYFQPQPTFELPSTVHDPFSIVDELVEYKIPDGSLFQSSPFSPKIDLQDRCYDGKRDQRSNVLHDGLGCLADSRVVSAGEFGRAFDTPAWQQHSIPSECLVGWNRSRWEDGRQLAADNKGVVDMVFRFSGLRNFSSLAIFALDLPSQKVSSCRVFKQPQQPCGPCYS